MTIDDRIQRLMELLAEVKLRASQPPPESADAPDAVDATAATDAGASRDGCASESEPKTFDPETTVVDEEPAPATAPDAPIAVLPPVKPLPEPPESLSRLIAAPRSGLDYDADGDTKTGLDDDDDEAEMSRELRIPAATVETRAYGPVESDAVGELDLDARSPGEAIGDLEDGPDIDDLGSGSLRAEERIERSPASSRRPVLPDDVAPALPDLEWDDTSTSDAPPESGNHVASSGHMRASVPVPTPSSVAPASSSSSSSASSPPVAAFVGTLVAPTPVTFGELLDATLGL